jgi:polysaccharide biosynthesis transport protein
MADEVPDSQGDGRPLNRAMSDRNQLPMAQTGSSMQQWHGRIDEATEARPAPDTDEGTGVTTPDGSWDLPWFANALSRRRWWAAGILVCAIACAGTYLRITTPVYVARAKLLIESQTPNVVSFKEVVEQNATRLDYYETQLGIMRSRTLARSTIDQLKLWDHPELQVTHSALDRVVLAVTSLWRDEVDEPEDSTVAQSRAIDKFLSRVKISYRADNRLVDVGYESADRKLAARVANAIARRYINQNLELKVQATREASTWLNARLAEQKKRVEESERALQRYREQNADMAESQRRNVTERRLSDLSTAATRARTERIEAEALLEQIQAALQNPSGAVVPLSPPNPLIQQLRIDLIGLQREEARLSQQFGDLHPDLVRVRASIARVEAQLKEEVEHLAESVRNQLSAASSKERSLEDVLTTQQQVTLALDRRGMQYDTLQRELDGNRQLFAALMERAKQTEISSELKIANVQIIDPAEVPRQPSAPRPVLVLALALMLGLPLGLCAAFGIEYMDSRIKSPEELRARLGVNFLGFAPKVRGVSSRASLTVTAENMPTEFAEAVRAIRANVFLAIQRQGPKSLVVTSTRPGEGKTVLATNLAIALAHAGLRVLLVDADMRGSQIHDMFEMPAEPGLAGVLEKTVPIETALRPSKIAGLTVLTAGYPKTSPSDLLAQTSVQTAIAPMRHQYDWIIIDTPPLRAASDATLLARDANAVVFVVGADTNWRHARSAMQELFAGHINVLGAVLSRSNMTQVPPEYAVNYSYYNSRHRH